MNNQRDLDKEDSGIDIYAQYRPKGSYEKKPSVSDSEDVDSGIDVYAQYRPNPQEVQKAEYENAAEKAKYGDYSRIGDEEGQKEIRQQIPKGILIGAGGAYGNLLELVGLKNRPEINEEDLTEAERNPEAQYFSDESLTPKTGGFPTSKDLTEANDLLGGPGKPKTPEGKAAERTSLIYGGGLPFLQFNPAPAILAGTAGQIAEEAGGGPLVQGAAEIVTLLLTQGRNARPVSSVNQAKQDIITGLRDLGYSEKEITLAINAQYANAFTKAIATKGVKTEEAFEQFATHSEDMVNNILRSEVPGIEKGSQKVHELASDAYGQVVQQAANIPIKNTDKFFDAMHDTVNEVKKVLGHNKDAKNFIIELTEDTLEVINNPNAETMINFYKRLNSLGKWVGRVQKDRILTKVKNSIKDTFKSEGKAGQQLAEDFERVNAGVQKAFKAEDVNNLIQKTKSQDGMDFKKLYKVFDDPENVKLFEEVLGPKQAKNIQTIARTGKEIKNFDTSWKVVNSVSGKVNVAFASLAGYQVINGDFEGLAKTIAVKGGTKLVGKLAEKSLTDPNYQNIMIKILHAIKNESPRTFRSSYEALDKYLKDEGIEIDLF
jgi:hypothetical protein